MSEFEKSVELEDLARDIIEKENLDLGGAKIDYLLVKPYKKYSKKAQCFGMN